jgi:HD-GYP domain-containing protein (c-di-GMP phosphodiesterase class II)
MQELVGLLTSMEHQQDHASKVSMILAWTLQAFPLLGIAVLEADATPSEGMSALASHGSLASIADTLAHAWSPSGVPQKQCLLALPAGAGDADVVLVRPLNFRDNVAWTALVFHGSNVEETLRAREADLVIVSSLLRDAVENQRMRRQMEREKALAAALAGPGASPHSATLPGLALLSDGLRLPLYVCDRQGAFLYASPAFLGLTEYASLEALQRARDFFADPKVRADELDTVRSLGKVTSFPIAVTAGTGRRLEIHDSAVSLGETFFGLFFDVTALMSANVELKDALQVQELLNDSILAGTKTLQRTQGAAIRSLARLAEYRDPETGFHLQRICEYTRLIALEVFVRTPYTFSITREYGDDISLSSMLHDIGKVSIPDSILLKPGKLDPAEWDMMKKHTIFGWEVLHKADTELGEQSFLTLAATIALSHHERYDGGGYPHGSKAEQIPLSARICALADVYDALTTARPYKEAWTHERAVEEIAKESGSHFDPVLVEIFRDINKEFATVRQQFPG